MEDNKLASLTLDKSMVEGIVSKAVRTAIISQLESGKDILIPKIADFLINGRMDRNGNLTSSTYETSPMIEYIFGKQMKEFAQAAIAEYIEKNKAELKKRINESLKNGKIAEALIGSMIENVKCPYTTKVDIKFEQNKNY